MWQLWIGPRTRREAKMMIPNGLTRDDPSSMPQSLPLVSKPISNHRKVDIVWISVSYWSDIILPIGWKLYWYLVGHKLVNYRTDIGLVSRPLLYHHLIHIACISTRYCKHHMVMPLALSRTDIAIEIFHLTKWLKLLRYLVVSTGPGLPSGFYLHVWQWSKKSTRPLVFTSASGCSASKNFHISNEN